MADGVGEGPAIQEMAGIQAILLSVPRDSVPV